MKLKVKKLKLFILGAGLITISSASLLTLVSCSSNDDKKALLDNAIVSWEQTFDSQITTSNFQNFVTTNITSNVDEFMTKWKNFVTYYDQTFKTSTLTIPFSKFTVYVYSYNLSLLNPITFNNDTFNLSLEWNTTFGVTFNDNESQLYKYHLVLKDAIDGASMMPTVLCSWKQLTDSKIQLYGGWYVNYAKQSNLSYSLTTLSGPAISKITELIYTALQLLNENNTDISIQNPSNLDWVSPAMILPLSNGNNQLKDYLINELHQLYNFPNIFKYYNLSISGFDYFLNQDYLLSVVNNPDRVYFDEFVQWLKSEIATNKNE